MVDPQEYNDWTHKSYPRRVLIGIDQLFNALLGGNPDETISGRIGKRIQAGSASKIEVMLCKLLSIVLFDPKHCVTSIELDEK